MLDRDPVIWIANDGGHSYHRAKDLVGNLEFRRFTVGNENPLNLDRLSKNLAEGIVKYGSPNDYIIISGTAMIPVMIVLLWILQFGEARLLQWKAKARGYQLNTVSERDLRELLDSIMRENG